MSWDDLDMELEQWQEDFDRRVEEGRREIRERIERVEQRCQEAEKVRRGEWEALKGRMMTAEEKQERRSDEFLRLMAAMTVEYVAIARSTGEDMKREFAESRAESRAQSEALMRMFDRLPPLENE
jgi:hypothetical protein